MEIDHVLYIIAIIMIILVLKTTKKILKYTLLALFGFSIFFVLSGCSKGNLNISNENEIDENTLLRVKDMPFIKKTQIDLDRSLILGEGKSWSGQIILSVPKPKPTVFNFYVKNIGQYGWKEQTTIRGEESILNYVGENNRVAIISVREASFNNSEVLISVSPYAEEFKEKVSAIINDKYLEITDWKEE